MSISVVDLDFSPERAMFDKAALARSIRSPSPAGEPIGADPANEESSSGDSNSYGTSPLLTPSGMPMIFWKMS